VEYRQGGINDPYIFKAVFMAGGPGSGKSFIATQLFAGMGVKFLNSDTSFEYLLRKRSLSFDIDQKNVEEYAKQMEAREWAKHLTNASQVHWLNGMLGLVLDGTGADFDRIKGVRAGLVAMGYDTSMAFVNTTLDVALQRNKERERTVDEEIVKESWQSVQNNMGKFQNLFGVGNFLVVDNSTKLSPQETQKLGMTLRKAAMKLLDKPLKNPIGKATVEFLRATGGKTLEDAKDFIQKKQKEAA
jgi:cytidylate kinase